MYERFMIANNKEEIINNKDGIIKKSFFILFALFSFLSFFE
jgi:hypothetical protein